MEKKRFPLGGFACHFSGVSGNDIWEFGNGNGNVKFHSRSSGTERELKKPVPSIREREGNEKKPFPKFGKGKGMKKSIPEIREREGSEKNPFPQFGNRNQRLSFPRIPGTGTGKIKT